MAIATSTISSKILLPDNVTPLLVRVELVAVAVDGVIKRTDNGDLIAGRFVTTSQDDGTLTLADIPDLPQPDISPIDARWRATFELIDEPYGSKAKPPAKIDFELAGDTTWAALVDVSGTPASESLIAQLQQLRDETVERADQVAEVVATSDGIMTAVAQDDASSFVGQMTGRIDQRTVALVPDLVVEALADDGAPAAAAAAAVGGVLNEAGVLRDGYKMDSVSTGYLWVVHDAANNVLLGITAEGKIEGILGDTSRVPYWTALADNPLNKIMAEAYGYLYVITDSADNVLFGIKTDGSVEMPGITPGVGTVTVTQLAPDVVSRLVIPPKDYDRARIGRNLYGPVATAAVRPLVSTVDGVCWGDSMSDGWPTSDFTDRDTMAYPGVLDSLLPGAVVHNGGSTGQSADEIAIRQGGLVLMLNVTGGAIPTTGGVTVTETSTIAWRLDRSFSERTGVSGVAGTLGGVPGRLTRSGSVLTFTRSADGAAVPVGSAQPFISTEGETYRDCWQILFIGRNDIGYTSAAGDIHDRVVNAYIAMVDRARLAVVRPRILIAGVLTASSETTGSTNHTLIKQINATLEALYPPSSNIAYAREGGLTTGRDLRGYLVNQAIVDLGITPTSTDLTKIAGDTLPPSIMAAAGADAVHYSVPTAAKVAAWWKNRLVEKGWATA